MPERPPTVVFLDEGGCSEVTDSDCGFVMCDFVPEGKTLDEVCGPTFQEGWQPDDADHDEQLVVDQLAACDIAEIRPADQADAAELGIRHLERDDGIVLSVRGTSAAIETAIETAVAECATTIR